MSLFALISFDLKDANREDYIRAYEDLAGIGLNGSVVDDQGARHTLPTTTCAGEFSGADASDLRLRLLKEVRTAFTARGFTSEIFIAVGDDWAWGFKRT